MKIQPKTVAQTLEELLKAHKDADPDLPNFAGRTDRTEGDIVTAILVTDTVIPFIRLELSDGSKFRIEVHAI